MAIEDFVEFGLSDGGTVFINPRLIEAISVSSSGDVNIETTSGEYHVKGDSCTVIKRIKNHKTTTAIHKASKY